MTIPLAALVTASQAKTLRIYDKIVSTVLEVYSHELRIGIEAPRNVPVVRA